MNKKNRYKSFLALLLSLTTFFAFSSTSLAAEENIVNPITEITSNSQNTTSVTPRGVLSGYNNGTTDHTDDWYSQDGDFYVDVTGSWSAFAGCSLKTEGFASDDCVIIHVYDESGTEKCSATLEGSSAEKKNIAIFNVSPGRYHVTFWVYSHTPGTVHCWIY